MCNPSKLTYMYGPCLTISHCKHDVSTQLFSPFSPALKCAEDASLTSPQRSIEALNQASTAGQLTQVSVR